MLVRIFILSALNAWFYGLHNGELLNCKLSIGWFSFTFVIKQATPTNDLQTYAIASPIIAQARQKVVLCQRYDSQYRKNLGYAFKVSHTIHPPSITTLNRLSCVIFIEPLFLYKYELALHF